MGKQETKPDKKPMRMVTSKMSIEETIEVLREDLKTNVRSKAVSYTHLRAHET